MTRQRYKITKKRYKKALFPWSVDKANIEATNRKLLHDPS